MEGGLTVETSNPGQTFNESEEEERVVLHVDFWNFLDLSPTEVKVVDPYRVASLIRNRTPP